MVGEIKVSCFKDLACERVLDGVNQLSLTTKWKDPPVLGPRDVTDQSIDMTLLRTSRSLPSYVLL